MIIQQGWQCPICRRVYSPTMSWCITCGNTVTCDATITTSSLGTRTNNRIVEEEQVFDVNEVGIPHFSLAESTKIQMEIEIPETLYFS